MQAIKPLVLLLSAGLGTRLGALTKLTPKPLIQVEKVKLIDLALWQLKKAGLTEIVVNLFYLGEKIAEYLGDGSQHGLSIRYSIENPILETGGAILKVMKENPGRDILIYNSDSVFDKEFDLNQLLNAFYNNPNSIAGMILVPANKSPTITASLIDDPLYEVTRVLQAKGSNKISSGNHVLDCEFSGVHILSQRAQKFMLGLGEIFSSTRDLYPKLLTSPYLVLGYFYQGYWRDCGTEDRLAEVRKAVNLGSVRGIGW